MIDYPLHAYAIVCDNGCIADAEGRFPDILRNNADWFYFQSRLDRAAITLMGRRSHETNANHRNRLRLVMSRSVSALEHRADGWWWNPAERSLPGALQMIIPEGGEVAVPGGRDVFDLLGAASFTAFHLARAHGRAISRGDRVVPRVRNRHAIGSYPAGRRAQARADAMARRGESYQLDSMAAQSGGRTWPFRMILSPRTS
jgi:hypothetical protein